LRKKLKKKGFDPLGALNATRFLQADDDDEGPFADVDFNASGVIELTGKGKHKKHKHKKSKVTKKVQMMGDTWAFDQPSGSWIRVALEGSSVPAPRWKHSGCRVDAEQAMVLFGGDKETSEKGMLNDLWVFKAKPSNGGEWKQFYTVNPPRRRRGHVTACNETHIIVIGGKSWTKKTDSIVNTDVWALPLEAVGFGEATAAKEAAEVAAMKGPVGEAASMDSSLHFKTGHTQLPVLEPLTWTRGTDFPGSPRWGATGTLLKGPDGAAFLAIFGGRNKNAGAVRHSEDTSAYTYYNELWLYNLQANSWSKAKVRGGPEPKPRDHHGATDLNGDLYVFGGRVMEKKTRDAVANDLWSYSLTTESWTLHKAVGAAPVPRFMPGVASAQWKGQGVVTIFGGESLPGSTKRTSLNDVWTYSVDEKGKGSWSELATSDCSAKAVAAEVLKELAEDLVEEGSGRSSAQLLLALSSGASLAFLSGLALASAPARRRLGGIWPLTSRRLGSPLLADACTSSTTNGFSGEQVLETGYISIS